MGRRFSLIIVLLLVMSSVFADGKYDTWLRIIDRNVETQGIFDYHVITVNNLYHLNDMFERGLISEDEFALVFNELQTNTFIIRGRFVSWDSVLDLQAHFNGRDADEVLLAIDKVARVLGMFDDGNYSNASHREFQVYEVWYVINQYGEVRRVSR
jgi:hypothetical protein